MQNFGGKQVVLWGMWKWRNYSTKNAGVNFRKYPRANGTDFSSMENDKPQSLVRSEFFNDFEV